jgi:glucose/arabinose dehydrogenase
LVLVAEGLIDPINASAPQDDSGQLIIVERTGTIRIIEDGELLDEPFLDLSAVVKIDFLEQGLLGLPFHPEYADNGRFFVFYEEYRTNGDHMIVEYAVSEDDPNVADPASGRVIMGVDNRFMNHNGGTITFGPDGYLYITLGDGGMAGDPHDHAQDPHTLLGTMLRIDVDNEGDEPYGIPADNPFAPGGREEAQVANQKAQTGEYKPERRPDTVCATRGSSASTARPVTCTSPMLDRCTGKRSTSFQRTK